MERWVGRVALVTGASSGIGFATAKELVKKGMKVAACARNVEKIQGLSEELKAEGGSLMAIKCDVSVEEQVTAMFEEVKGQWGGVDVCINNAGLSHAAPLIGGDYSSWRHIMDVNVIGLSMCTHQAIKSMQDRGVDDGQIIHINSMSGHRVVPSKNGHFYSASKYAVTALTEGLRNELREMDSHIRVASISPGLVATEFNYRAVGETEASVMHGRQKNLEAEDIMDAVLYILACPGHVQVHDVLVRPTEQKA